MDGADWIPMTRGGVGSGAKARTSRARFRRSRGPEASRVRRWMRLVKAERAVGSDGGEGVGRRRNLAV